MTAPQLVTTRLPQASILVRLRIDDIHGVGEATPLPGYSPDTIDEAERALTCRAALPSLDPDDAPGWLRSIGALASPAAQFALETAALDLAGKLTGRPVRALLHTNADKPRPVPINALVATVAEARAAFARGIRTFKVKVGRQPFDAEINLLRALRHELGDDVELRVDANGAWSADEARGHLEQLDEVSLQYAEEPVASADLPLFTSPVTIAADESLRSVPMDRLLQHKTIGVVVLKPMLLGGAIRCTELAARARTAGVRVVVSHMLDGPIALAACAELALALAPELACGLAPHAGLHKWPSINVPQLSASEITPSETVGLGCTGVEALWA